MSASARRAADAEEGSANLGCLQRQNHRSRVFILTLPSLFPSLIPSICPSLPPSLCPSSPLRLSHIPTATERRRGGHEKLRREERTSDVHVYKRIFKTCIKRANIKSRPVTRQARKTVIKTENKCDRSHLRLLKVFTGKGVCDLFIYIFG